MKRKVAANALCGGRGGGEKLVKLEEKMSEEDHYCVRWKGRNEHEGSEVRIYKIKQES